MHPRQAGQSSVTNERTALVLTGRTRFWGFQESDATYLLESVQHSNELVEEVGLFPSTDLPYIKFKRGSRVDMVIWKGPLNKPRGAGEPVSREHHFLLLISEGCPQDVRRQKRHGRTLRATSETEGRLLNSFEPGVRIGTSSCPACSALLVQIYAARREYVGMCWREPRPFGSAHQPRDQD